MGKKVKVGKQRKDKYYHLAKEAGYRSRAAFKLIQLNKRFEFLQRSRAVVDLCAAPGGWLQVASQNMPVSSLCIGVDLVPIKPIKNCITLQGDITTEKTRQMIKKELQTWDADCVLHDGAPNVGLNWLHDAFQQNCLVLSALRLATQILTKNGVFVTKIFRSNDYQSLITVFEKLFKKVSVWKPAASRLESAEIFVVCEKYLKPAKVNFDLLDPKKVFLEASLEVKATNPQLMLVTNKKEKKSKAEGYEDGELSLFKALPASEFIYSRDYLDLLSKANKIVLDDKRWEEDEATTEEIRHCIEDIKVCGPRELRQILAWRRKLVKTVQMEAEAEASSSPEDDMEVNEDPDAVEDEIMAKIDEEIQEARAKDKALLKKKKKKLLKEKAKVAKRKQLGMVHEGDEGVVATEQDLFSLRTLAKAKDLATLSEHDGSGFEHEDDGGEGTSEDGHSEVSDTESDGEEENGGGLIHTEEFGLSKEEKRAKRVSNWFSREGIADVLDDDDDALAAIEKHLGKKVSTAKLYENTVSFGMKDGDGEASVNDGPEEEATGFVKEEEESDEEFHDEDKRVAKRAEKEDAETKPKKRRLDPELLALGEQLVHSSKTKRDLEDWTWNRYTNNDEGLPDWFVEDEKKHYRKELPVTKEQVERYKERLKELNARPIKKIADAKARKRRRELLRLQRAKKKAENVVENENMEAGEKAREMRKIYRKTKVKEKKEVTYQVMTKGKRGRLARPGGVYKVVDARQKKDNRREKVARREKAWKKMSSSARKAEMEKAKTRRRNKKSERVANRRMKRGKPV